MDINDFDFDLPEELIAQYPSDRRDEARLMIVDRKSGKIRHTIFKELPLELKSESLLILNDSRVTKSRLYGRTDRIKRCEVFIHRIIDDYEFYALLRPHKKIRKGDRILVGDEGFCLEVVDIDKNNIQNRLKIISKISVKEMMNRAGHIPLPPYIKREDLKGFDDERYQTIFSKKDGSVAAPTAGLHFTEDLFKRLKERGINYDFITLYVGIGTFMPVRVRDITQHRMHSEEYEISDKTADLINEYKREKKEVIAVGTTTVRTLESNFLINGKIVSGRFSTDIFIYPGFKFNVIDSLITNFHLPRSTLFMLVCAFAGRELMLYVYNEAIKERYRFFSYGDAMLIK